MPLFIVDTNFFIQSHRITYPLDIAKGFWGKVKNIADSGNIISIDKVKNEIFKNDDELKKWIENNLSAEFFKPTNTPEILSSYARIANWTNSRNTFYLPKAITEFLQYENADAWLVAYTLSLTQTCCIVTQEKSEPN